ncbi:MAG: DUF63 family protein [Candidatus Micrarchaeota archaeon]
MDVLSPLSDFIRLNYLVPMWSREGYTPINTLTYALIAIGALYLIWRYMEKRKIPIDEDFTLSCLAWVLFGSSLRILTDAVDAGTLAKAVSSGALGASSSFLAGPLSLITSTIYPFLLSSHLFDYPATGVLDAHLLNISPGIYVLTAALFFASFALSRKMGRPYFSAFCGFSLGLLNLVLLLPLFSYWLFAGFVLVLVALVAAFLWFGLKWRTFWQVMPVLAHALDGAATWVAIDWFGPAMGIPYFEQHVLSGGIGSATPLGFGLFFILKVAFAAGAVHLLSKEEDTRMVRLALLVIMVIGFAPGLRDLLRMLAGT